MHCRSSILAEKHLLMTCLGSMLDLLSLEHEEHVSWF